MHRFRHEYKYMIDPSQECVLRICAQGVLLPDAHVDEHGGYLIRSLYFDDDRDTCLQENINGTDPRSKFRIRYYNNDTSVIRLEKKSKARMMTLKESCSLTEAECRCLLEGGYPAITDKMPKIKQKLLSQLCLRNLKPKVIVTYERIPFVYPGGNVRVTFDKAITSSSCVAAFLEGDYPVRPILPLGKSVLEVKWDELLPAHIKGALRLDSLQWSAFSKYHMCRTFHL